MIVPSMAYFTSVQWPMASQSGQVEPSTLGTVKDDCRTDGISHYMYFFFCKFCEMLSGTITPYCVLLGWFKSHVQRHHPPPSQSIHLWKNLQLHMALVYCYLPRGNRQWLILRGMFPNPNCFANIQNPSHILGFVAFMVVVGYTRREACRSLFDLWVRAILAETCDKDVRRFQNRCRCFPE